MKKNLILITKLDAARRQLETAIQLFFAGGDFVSIHSLSFAAYTITRNLCDSTQNPNTFAKFVCDRIVDSQHTEFLKCLNKAGNYFKHADRDPKDILEYIRDQYDLFIIMSVWQYEAITGEATMPMAIYKIWHLTHDGGMVRVTDSKLQKQLPGIREHLPSNKREFYDRVSKLLREAQRKLLIPV